ncbi:MAG: Bro-N domain-containing protein [Sellimonas intestinalis]
MGKDVAEKLGYEIKIDIQRHVDEEDRIMLNAETQYQNGTEFDYKILGQRGGWIINESGLYALIFGSKLESAKRFKHWVTSEVLPAIRKTGTYNLTPQNHMELMFQDMKMEWKLVYAQINNLSDVVEKQNKQFTQVVDNITLTTVQQRKIYSAGKDRISELLGGAHSAEYKKQSRSILLICGIALRENLTAEVL